MKFCPMCGTVQDKRGTVKCEYCDYEEKRLSEFSPQEVGELMAPYNYEEVEGGIRLNSVKNIRSMRGAVAIPNFVTEIAANAFSCCKFLTRIDLPNGLRSIGDGAFAECRDLFDVFIPLSVISVGKGVFANSYDLSVVCVAAPSQPSGWDSEWLLDCDAKVEWSSIDD